MNYNYFYYYKIEKMYNYILILHIDTGIIELNVKSSYNIQILDEPVMELYDLILGGEALTRDHWVCMIKLLKK